MITATHKDKSLEIEFTEGFSKGKLNNNEFEINSIDIKKNYFHVIRNHKSYNVEVLEVDKLTKSVALKINGNKYEIQYQNKFDKLLKDMGIDVSASAKVKDIKAPMPGLVLDIKVEIGTEVMKGDALLVLEAMKMENIIKSPSDGIVKKINVSQNNAVEKNEVLINFE